MKQKEKPLSIVVGSTNRHKLNAVREACKKLKMTAKIAEVKARSGQNEQPVGLEETYNGAFNRANAVFRKLRPDFSIGIESGILRIPHLTIDIAVIVIIEFSGREIVTISCGFEFPNNLVEEAKERGFTTTTVGSVIAERFHGDPTDPYASLSKRKVTRKMLLVGALVIALRQRSNS